MMSWRDFQTAKERVRPRTARERTVRSDAASTDVRATTESSASSVSDQRMEVPRSFPIIEKILVVLAVAAFFWETAGVFALIVMVRYFNWQGSTGMWLGAAYLVVVHWYGLRKERGMQLLIMWAVLFLVAFLVDFMRYGAGSPGSGGVDCEWGRYALPC